LGKTLPYHAKITIEIMNPFWFEGFGYHITVSGTDTNSIYNVTESLDNLALGLQLPTGHRAYWNVI